MKSTPDKRCQYEIVLHETIKNHSFLRADTVPTGGVYRSCKRFSESADIAITVPSGLISDFLQFTTVR